MASSANVTKLKINVMPELVHNYLVDAEAINENELYLVEPNDPNVLSFNGPITSTNADYAICFEWADGNPNKEDRNHRFVQLADDGNKISFAKANSDICGITTTCAAFIENYAVHSEYTSAVGILGIVSVIDNGTCTVGSTCMPDDNGYAVPSSNNMGYRVIARIDDSRISVVVKPNDDMIQRIKTDIMNITDGETINSFSEVENTLKTLLDNTNTVKYDEQTLNDEQKNQARVNINAQEKLTGSPDQIITFDEHGNAVVEDTANADDALITLAELGIIVPAQQDGVIYTDHDGKILNI